MSIKIETPPILSGAAEAQLRQVYAYLYRLSEHLNVALQEIDGDLSGTQASAVTAAVAAQSDAAAKTYNELRALVVNTAEIVRSEMDRLETELHGSYESISSRWGAFRENIDAVITATAREVVQEYDYDASIKTLQQQAAGFDAYRMTTEGCIRQGFIDYDGSGVPILGIAIGQGLTGTAVTIDGETYEQFNSTQSCAFYTSEKVSFRINGQEVAYLSNRKLYIGDVEVTGSFTFGDWMLTGTNGLTVKWIGGVN